MNIRTQLHPIIRYLAVAILAAAAFGAVTMAAAGLSRAQTATTSDAVSTATTATSTVIDTTISQTDLIQSLLNRIVSLEQQVGTLRWQLNNMMMSMATSTPGVPATGGTGTTTAATSTAATSTISATISYTLHPLNKPGLIDFTGRNFGIEEDVTVSRNGTLVTTAHADGGGNFSTGSIAIPTASGAYTYTFRGTESGILGTVEVNVISGQAQTTVM